VRYVDTKLFAFCLAESSPRQSGTTNRQIGIVTTSMCLCPRPFPSASPSVDLNIEFPKRIIAPHHWEVVSYPRLDE
jgi:hypothetical protein